MTKILKRKTVYPTPWFDLIAQWVPGCKEPYYALRAPDYVSVVAMTSAQRILLIRQFRPAVRSSTLELPSGTVDPGNTPLGTAKSELLEETGHRAGRVRLAGWMRPDTGRMSNRLWIYYAEGCEPVRGVRPEAGIRVESVTLASLERQIRSGTFGHALNVAAFALVQRKFDLPSPRQRRVSGRD